MSHCDVGFLIKEGKPLSFASIAKEAGVSVSYLYKYDDIKQQIQELRKQQNQFKKPTAPQPASDKSKMVIIGQLRERIKKLEAERDGLRRVNEGITGRLHQLLGIEEQASRLRTENALLKKQLDDCCRHHAPTQTSPTDKPKVASLSKKQSQRLNKNDFVFEELDQLGIRMNSTLSKLIKSAPQPVVLKAIDALKEALTTGIVRNPSGFLVSAIRNAWIPNEE